MFPSTQDHLRLKLIHIFENQCHKPRYKKNAFLALKVGKNSKKYALKPNLISIIMFLANRYDFKQLNVH